MENDTRTSPVPVQPTDRFGTVPPVQPVLPTAKRRGFDPRIFFLLLLAVGLVGGIWAGLQQLPQPTAPTPTQMPTPTQGLIVKPTNAIATQSAFMDLSGQIASLTGAINGMQVSDTTLVPPTIELPLGFPNQ